MPSTLQSIFDKVWNYFVVEKHPRAWNQNTMSCMLRTPEGYKCAIGILIPDELYEPQFEKWILPSLEHHLAEKGVEDFVLLKDNNTYACALQVAHDRTDALSMEFHDRVRKNLTEMVTTHPEWALQIPKEV